MSTSGLTASMIDGTAGGMGSVVTRVRHLRLSKSARCASTLFLGEVKSTFATVSKSDADFGTYSVAGLDGSQQHCSIAQVVWANVGHYLAVLPFKLARAELLHEPPSQAVDGIGKLGVADGVEGRILGPHAKRSLWLLVGQLVKDTRYVLDGSERRLGVGCFISSD